MLIFFQIHHLFIVTKGSWDQTYSWRRTFVSRYIEHVPMCVLNAIIVNGASHLTEFDQAGGHAQNVTVIYCTVITVRKGSWTVDFSGCGYSAKALLPPGNSFLFQLNWLLLPTRQRTCGLTQQTSGTIGRHEAKFDFFLHQFMVLPKQWLVAQSWLSRCMKQDIV